MRVLSVLALAAVVACRSHAPNDRLTKLAIDAAAGDTEARYNLAVELYRGDSIPRDYSRAAALWKQGMERGNINATNNYAYLLYYGLGIARDQGQAVALWKRAAALGQAESQYHLGVAALDGGGESADTSEALARFKAALALALRSSDPTDHLVARDVRTAMRALPTLAQGERARADSLSRVYVGGDVQTRN